MNLPRMGVSLAPMNPFPDSQTSPRCDEFETPRPCRRLQSLRLRAANCRGTDESTRKATYTAAPMPGEEQLGVCASPPSPGVRVNAAVHSQIPRNRSTAIDGLQT